MITESTAEIIFMFPFLLICTCIITEIKLEKVSRQLTFSIIFRGIISVRGRYFHQKQFQYIFGKLQFPVCARESSACTPEVSPGSQPEPLIRAGKKEGMLKGYAVGGAVTR